MPKKTPESPFVPQATPIGTKEVTKAEISTDIEKNKSENKSGLPDHQELGRTYHALERGDKAMMAEKTIEEVWKKFPNSEDVRTMEDLPDLTDETFADTFPEDGEESVPHIYKKHVEGNNYLIVMVLNNGKPGTTVSYSVKTERGGRFKKELEANKRGDRMFHLGTEQELDDARKATNRNYWSTEGKWMRGKITSEEYRRKFHKRHKKWPYQAHDERDEKLSGKLEKTKDEEEVRIKQRAERNVDQLQEKGFETAFESMVTDMEEAREESRRERLLAEQEKRKKREERNRLIWEKMDQFASELEWEVPIMRIPMAWEKGGIQNHKGEDITKKATAGEAYKYMMARIRGTKKK